jgi:hypothetical protein
VRRPNSASPASPPRDLWLQACWDVALDHMLASWYRGFRWASPRTGGALIRIDGPATTLQAYRMVASGAVHGGKFPMSAKKIAKKKARPATNKRANRVSKKTAPPARKRKLPRKEVVPGYTRGLPDLQKWPERPFYTGKDSVPFSRLGARLFNVPPMKNEFYLV